MSEQTMIWALGGLIVVLFAMLILVGVRRTIERQDARETRRPRDLAQGKTRRGTGVSAAEISSTTAKSTRRATAVVIAIITAVIGMIAAIDKRNDRDNDRKADRAAHQGSTP